MVVFVPCKTTVLPQQAQAHALKEPIVERRVALSLGLMHASALVLAEVPALSSELVLAQPWGVAKVPKETSELVLAPALGRPLEQHLPSRLEQVPVLVPTLAMAVMRS